ncbi:MAG: DNA polymerase III subunit delta [Planctomycetes bacterium]|nr:DNA polymerase III subunit delta [Planctomycetota bacterium]
MTEKIYPVYVIFGKDRHQVVDAYGEVVDQVLQGADRQVSLSVYEPTVELAAVLDDAQTLPFLSPRKLVAVEDADSFITRYREQLEKYLEKPSETGVLVLLCEHFPGNTRLAKRVKVIGKAIACEPLKSTHLVSALISYANKQHRLRLTPGAAETLVDLGGEDVHQLKNELDKIAIYLGGTGSKPDTIEADDVAKLTGNNRQINVFGVIDAMSEQNAAGALTQLDQMLRQDRDAQFKAVGAFGWHFRKLYKGRIMLDQGTDPRVMVKQLRVWSGIDAFLRQVKRLRVEQIGQLLRELVRIDYQSKTGASTVRSGLEKLIIGFCGRKSMEA